MGFVDALIYVHIALGAVALLAGGAALSSRKGMRWHRISGKVFSFSMLLSALLASVVAVLPGHVNIFLFAIGLFSSYFIVSGYRSLRFKTATTNLKVDKILAIGLVVVGVGLISYPLIADGSLNVVATVFGAVGVVFGIRDLRMLRDPATLRRTWMRLHLGKMTGGYIASVTAFFVVNNILPGIMNWFVPGIIGGFFIAYWIRKINVRKASVNP